MKGVGPPTMPVVVEAGWPTGPCPRVVVGVVGVVDVVEVDIDVDVDVDVDDNPNPNELVVVDDEV